VSGSGHPLVEAAKREVIGLHAFFEAWLAGTCPGTADCFARLETALSASFTMVPPDGRRLSRPGVIEGLRLAHGGKGTSGPFRITIRGLEVLHLAPPLVALGYVEEQVHGDAFTRRRSTALFASLLHEAERVEWLALHETWIEGKD
jgi:hypothetical protein